MALSHSYVRDIEFVACSSSGVRKTERYTHTCKLKADSVQKIEYGSYRSIADDRDKMKRRFCEGGRKGFLSSSLV